MKISPCVTSIYEPKNKNRAIFWEYGPVEMHMSVVNISLNGSVFHRFNKDSAQFRVKLLTQIALDLFEGFGLGKREIAAGMGNDSDFLHRTAPFRW